MASATSSAASTSERSGCVTATEPRRGCGARAELAARQPWPPACTPRRWGRAARWSPSATASSARARTGPRSPRRSPTTTGCCSSTCPTTAGPAWRDHFDYVDVADQVAELFERRRPGRAGRPLDGRQGRDGAGAAAPRAGRAAVRRRRVAGGLPSRAASSPATSRRCRRSTSAALERRGDADAALVEAVPEPDRAQLPAAEPPPQRRRLVVAAQPRRARPRPRRARRLAGGGARRRRAVRRADAVGRGAELGATSGTSTPRRWTAGSRATAGSRSRAPGTGCTPSSRQVFTEVLRRFLA